MSTVHTQTGEADEVNNNPQTNKQSNLQPKEESGNSRVDQTGTAPPEAPQKFVKVTKLSKADQLKLSDAFGTLSETLPGQDASKAKVGFFEMKKCINQLGVAVGDESISKHCEVDEEDGELKMNYRSFEKCYTEIMRSQPVTQKSVNKFYTKLDCLKEGHVTFEALRNWCFKQDIVLPEDELEMMMRSADENLDGKITDKEFTKLMFHINTLRTPSSKKK